MTAVTPSPSTLNATDLTLFLCGDVMLGRGIDQILPHPSDPVLYEGFVRDARRYLELAELANGRIPRHVAPDYVWGDALAEWHRRRPDVRIINLETSVTRRGRPWLKGINYRMNPRNIAVLTIAEIDCCVLANNHVLDWGREGLAETLTTLHSARIEIAGVGRSATARSPAVLPLGEARRLLVFAAATDDAGVPASWAASDKQSGVNRLPDLSSVSVARIAADIRRNRRDDDIVVFSLHWGGNWGYEISSDQRGFAHALIDETGVDVMYCHSSHHPKAAEVHNGHLVLYGCGDFLNDYEGIEGHEEFRGELGLMYFPRLDSQGRLQRLALVPTRVRAFRIQHASDQDRSWLLGRLRREYRRMGCDLAEAEERSFSLEW